MKKVTLLTSTAAILAALSVPAFAQSEISTGADAAGVSAINDRITDIEEDVTDAFDRDNDADRFGPADRRQGLFGNMSLSYTGRTGNTDNQDLAIGGRVNYNQGVFAQSVGLSLEFGEDDFGNKDQEDVAAIYDAQYYFNDQLYAFALGRINQNGLVDGVRNSPSQTDEDFADEFSDFRTDAFLGFGPGYRILNSEQTTWRVQAGVGVRYTKTGAQEAGFASFEMLLAIRSLLTMERSHRRRRFLLGHFGRLHRVVASVPPLQRQHLHHERYRLPGFGRLGST